MTHLDANEPCWTENERLRAELARVTAERDSLRRRLGGKGGGFICLT